jgi:hypothetical protein
MSGLPGDENPNPQWQRPSQDEPRWQPQWQQGSPLGDQAEQAEQTEGQQQQQPWQQQNPQWQPSPRTPGKAIASLILSIVGILFCPYIFSVLGLVFGYMARGEIQRAAGGLAGEGLALAGIIISWAGLAVWTLFFVAVFTF